MADCDLNVMVAPSRQGIIAVASNPSTSLPSLVTNVVDGDAIQQMVISGSPAGGAITLTYDGQTTASFPAIPSPPGAYCQWVVTGLTPGASYKLWQNIPLQGGTESPSVRSEILDPDDSAVLGYADLNHQGDLGQSGGPVNPTPLPDSLLLDRWGAPVKWYPLGSTWTTATGTLRVRCSCDRNAFGDKFRFTADQLRIQAVSDGTVTRLDSADAHFTYASFYGNLGRGSFSRQAADSTADSYVVDGIEKGQRRLVSPATVQARLEALSNIAPGDVIVSGDGSALNPLKVKFTSTLGGVAQPLMSATPTDGTIAVSDFAVGGILPSIKINGGAAIPLPHEWLYYGSIRPNMPTVGFLFPQPLPDEFQYQIAGQHDNDVLNSEGSGSGNAWDKAFNGGPGDHLYGYGGQIRNATGVGPIARYCYRPTPPGSYRVSATWPTNAGLSADVVYTVRDLDGNSLGTYHVNQTVEPSGSADAGNTGRSRPWQTLGTYTLGRSTNGGHFNGLIVTQSNAAGGVMVADAVRFERLSLAEPTLTIDDDDVVTYSAGAGWMTSAIGPAPAATDVTVDNRAGGYVFDKDESSATTMRTGWNIPTMVRKLPAYYTNLVHSAENEVIPTILSSSTGSIQVADSASPVGGDQISPPNVPAGFYDILWKSSNIDVTGSNGIDAGYAEDVSRRIYPAVDANGYHRRTYEFKTGVYNYGTEITLTLVSNSPRGDGTYNCDLPELWVVPRDTNVLTAPKYNATFTSNLTGAGTLRFLDPLTAIDGNNVDFSDYTKPQDHLSRNSRPISVSIPMAGATIRQYTGTEYTYDTRYGVLVEFTFPASGLTTAGHGLKLGQMFLLNNYTGDLGSFDDGGTATESEPGKNDGSQRTAQVAANRMFVLPLADPHKFVTRIDPPARTVNGVIQSPYFMTNVISNAGGTLEMTQGANLPLQDIIEIVNNTGSADLYFNGHFANTDACSTAIGDYVGQHLAAGRIFRYEHSNEVWNFTNSPFAWASMGSSIFHGGSGNDYNQYYCEQAHRKGTLVKAAWVAAGRDPADFRLVMGGIQADRGKAANYASYFHAQGWEPFDELVVANYMGNQPGNSAPQYDREFAFYRVIDGMTPDQHLDWFDLHRTYGKYEDEIQAQKDSMTGGGTRPEFADVQVGFYEGGPDILLLQARDENHSFPYGLMNNGYKNHACQRSPRFYHSIQNALKVHEIGGAVYQNIFMYQGSDTPNIEAWGATRRADQPAYAPGDPAVDAILTGQVDRVDLQPSVTLGAVKDFSSRYLAEPPTDPDFSIAVTGSGSLVQGGTATRTVTMTVINGYAGTAALTAAGLPTGVTGSFSPTSLVGGGTVVSTLTLNATGSASVGTATISVTATDATNSLVHSGSSSLTVSAAGGALAAGTATGGSTTSTTTSATATDATGGTTPYAYQWYRSTTSGQLGGAVSGQTTRTLSDAGLTASTTYYYTLRYTDSAGTPTVVSSNQISLTTASAGGGGGGVFGGAVARRIRAFRFTR